MFFENKRLRSFRKMILAESPAARSEVMQFLLGEQRGDFQKLFEAMNSYSVCVRLLDPPLHEFLPSHKDEAEIATLAKELHFSKEEILNRMNFLGELNPMLGHRGCRLGITHPDVYEMQVRALARAMRAHFSNRGRCTLKVMIPLIAEASELRLLLPSLQRVYREELESLSDKERREILKFTKWGTMIELPRACLVADEIAPQVDFISFGTNDLTQTTFGLSRDDSNKFLPDYLEKGVMEVDPFQTIDVEGVGALVSTAVNKARSVYPKIEISVCGEHGGDPQSIGFFQGLRFDAVSCSPFRVPVARLACAQAGLKSKIKVVRKKKGKK